MFRTAKLPLWLLVLLGWTAYSLVFTVQIVQMNDSLETRIGLPEALKLSLGGWLTWVPLTLGLHWLVQRQPIERGRVLRALGLQLAGVLMVVFLRAAYVYATDDYFQWYGGQPLPDFSVVLATSMSNNFLLAWLVVGIAHGLVFLQRSQQHEQQVRFLEASLAASRLEALRAQLNPHFLFNALNSVAEMVHRDADVADRMLVSLSALLRDGLSTDPAPLRPLREELALVNHYLMIEKIRLAERLVLELDIPDVCLDVPVPALVLQPLVENAIVHGIARRRAPGLLRVSAALVEEGLMLEVKNNVAPGASAPGNGIGLASTKSRLALLYGDRATLEQRTGVDGLYRVQVVIPSRPDPVEIAAPTRAAYP